MAAIDVERKVRDTLAEAGFSLSEEQIQTFVQAYPLIRAGADSLFEVTNHELGFNLGGGAIGFVSDHVGFRGDVRYFRQFADPEPDNEFDVGVGDLDFWRATAGITFRW